MKVEAIVKKVTANPGKKIDDPMEVNVQLSVRGRRALALGQLVGQLADVEFVQLQGVLDFETGEVDPDSDED